MGKYSKIIGQLKPAPEDPKKFERVRAEMDKIRLDDNGAPIRRTPEELGRGFALAKLDRDLKAAELSELQAKMDAWARLVHESWDRDEKGWGMYGAAPNDVRLPDGSGVRCGSVPEGSVEDKDLFRTWCEAPADKCFRCGEEKEGGFHGEDSLSEEAHKFLPGGDIGRKLALPVQTMNSIAKQYAEAGKPPPPGVKVWARPTVKYVSPTKRAGDDEEEETAEVDVV